MLNRKVPVGVWSPQKHHDTLMQLHSHFLDTLHCIINRYQDHLERLYSYTLFTVIYYNTTLNHVCQICYQSR